MPVSHSSQRSELSRPWQFLQAAPRVLQVYWLTGQDAIPETSVIHVQRRQEGFFKHPILVTQIDSEKKFAYFYATTSNLSSGISDLKMFFEIGLTIHGDADTLKLERGSMRMKWLTYVNLEQRYEIEWRYLQTWAVPVRLDLAEMDKFENRIQILESKQNRYLYRPLAGDFRTAEPGTVFWLPNPQGSRTLGSTVLLIRNQYPYGEFLRVKEQSNTPVFTGMPGKYWMLQRYQCLRICNPLEETPWVPGIPDLFIAPKSPPMNRKSYVHITKQMNHIRLDTVQSFCVPPVRISAESMTTLLQYLEDLPATQIAPTPAYNTTGYGQAIAHESSSPLRVYHAGDYHHVPVPLYSGFAGTPTNPSVPLGWLHGYPTSFGGQGRAETQQDRPSF